jgi:hypothetical protein
LVEQLTRTNDFRLLQPKSPESMTTAPPPDELECV